MFAWSNGSIKKDKFKEEWEEERDKEVEVKEEEMKDNVRWI